MEVASGAGIAFRLLGSVEAWRDGERVPLGGPRQQALLALLLLEPGRAVTTDHLVDELWAGEPSEGADITLRTYVSRLRSALDRTVPITSTSTGYSIAVDEETVDARRFEALVRKGEVALARRNAWDAREHLTAALDLWHGPPFGALAVDGVLRVEAERLAEVRLRAIERRIEADLELGLAAELIEELEAAVRAHPFRERLWRHLMLALYRAGRQADALATYHRARRELDEQLGIEPGPELRDLEAAILRQDVPPATPPEQHHNLPEAITPFIGRRNEVATIEGLLREHRLVTLVGVGGVGKTRLGVEVARRFRRAMPDGIHFVDLSPLTDPGHVPGAVGTAFDIREQPAVDPTDRLVGQLRGLSALVVLDNCEHLKDAAADLANRILRACPEIRLLATSREVLGVPGEVDHPVPPLELPDADDLPSAADSEAVQLFLARARAVRPAIAADEETIRLVAQIVAALDGLPLAIELAAARARVLAPGEIADRLHDRFRFLVSWRRLSAARHRTLREAMDWSYELLDAPARRLLAGLAVFSGGCTLAAAAAVCTDGDEAPALEGLERLIEASLVTLDTSRAPSRYRLLETVRQYAADRLEAEGATAELRDRHAEHFTRFAEESLPNRRPDQASLGRIADDAENVRAALAWSRESGAWDRVLRIAEGQWWALWIWGRVVEARQWLELAVEHATDAPVDLLARAELGAGGMAWAQTDYDAADRWASSALRRFAALGNSHMEGAALNVLGLAAHGRHDYGRARELFEQALAVYRRPELDPRAVSRNIAVATDNLGSMAYELDDMDAAEAHFREALASNQARADSEGVAMNELHLASVASVRGDTDAARPLLLSALRVYRELGFLQYAAECLESATMVANGAREFRTTGMLLGASAAMRERAGAPPVPFHARMRAREEARARAALGDEEIDAAISEGRALTADDAMRRTLEFLST